MIFLTGSEPIFAYRVQVKGRFRVYYDEDGAPACCNFSALPNPRICCICHNACVQFIVDDKSGEYTCSACGKFPRELLLQ